MAGELARRARPGDLVITMGAGDVTTLGPDILAALAGTRGAPVSPPTRVAPPRPAPARRGPLRPRRGPAARHRGRDRGRRRWPPLYVVGFTGVLGVRQVTVTGVRALSADQVRAAAGVPDGQPLARVDTGAVADHVRALPGVERVAVARSWPGTLRITITERHGVAVVKRAGPAGWSTRTGSSSSGWPPGPKLPLLDLTDVGPNDAATATAALAAVTALPPRLLAGGRDRHGGRPRSR